MSEENNHSHHHHHHEGCNHDHHSHTHERTPRTPVAPKPFQVTQTSEAELQNLQIEILETIQKAKDQDIHRLAIVLNDRQVVYRDCPPKGVLPLNLVEMCSSLLPPDFSCKVVVVCNTDALKTHHPSEAVPFFSILIGLAYIGHKVILFEGDMNAIKVLCKDADVCIVDGAMVELLEKDACDTIEKLIKNEEMYIFDRETLNLYERK